MNSVCVFSLIVIFKIASAQVIPFGPRNVPSHIANAGLPLNAPNAAGNVLNGINAAKLATAPLTNAQLINENLAVANLNNGAINNINIAHDLANANLAALATANLAGINGNVATFNLGNDAHLFSVTSGSPGSPGFGIQVLADALEVGGTVTVNGQIPIYGTVAVNGNVPTDGMATVNFNCGRPAAAVVV